MIERRATSFPPLLIAANSKCWQIDNDDLPPPLDNGDWESLLAEALVDVAARNAKGSLLCSTSIGESVDFGRHGWSVGQSLLPVNPRGTTDATRCCAAPVHSQCPANVRPAFQ